MVCTGRTDHASSFRRAKKKQRTPDDQEVGQVRSGQVGSGQDRLTCSYSVAKISGSNKQTGSHDQHHILDHRIRDTVI